MTSMQFFHHREKLVLCHGHGIIQNSECVNRFIRMLPFLQRLPRWYKILIYLRGSPTLSSFSLGILLEKHLLIFSRFFFSLERGFESKHFIVHIQLKSLQVLTQNIQWSRAEDIVSIGTKGTSQKTIVFYLSSSFFLSIYVPIVHVDLQKVELIRLLHFTPVQQKN